MKPGRVFLFIILAVASSLRASTEVSVDAGWGGKFRPGRWTPIFVTARDTQSRNVILEFYAPHDHSFAMHVRQGFAIGPEALTYPLFVPLRDDVLDESVATLRDVRSGRELAHDVVADPYGRRAPFRQTISVGDDQIFLGVSGTGTTMRTLENQFAEEQSVNNSPSGSVDDEGSVVVQPPQPGQPKKATPRPVTVGFLEQRRLPAAPIGYDALDALVLNRPDFNALSNEQQQAIVDWVRAGGRLLIWPGDDPLPALSPLINVLPCRVGDVKQSNLDVAALRSAGLPERFAKLKARQLAPAANAEPMKFFGGDNDAVGYGRRLGFGQILVLSFDAGSLQFDKAEDARKFWRPILDTIVDPPEESPQNYYNGHRESQRHANAMQATMQQLGEIPGIGTFGFSYVAGVLIAMMVIVGPVDWFVLRWLGKQPWTWVTTAGWIALITLGAIYIGHIFKSGDLYYRSLRLIDEADGQIVATRDVACIYSPRTTTYSIDTDPESWWQPVSADMMGYSRGGIKNDLNYEQSYRGNTPDAMLINVWNLRFLEGEQFSPAEPSTIEAKLLVTEAPPKTNKMSISGSITNHGTFPLHDVTIRVKSGSCAIKNPIAPGQTITLQQELQPTNANAHAAYNYYDGNIPRTTEGAIQYDFVADLNLGRAIRIERLLNDRPLADIFARVDGVEARNPLHESGAREEHRQVIHALVALQPQEGTP